MSQIGPVVDKSNSKYLKIKRETNKGRRKFKPDDLTTVHN